MVDIDFLSYPFTTYYSFSFSHEQAMNFMNYNYEFESVSDNYLPPTRVWST